jgi:uncharacterized protein YdaU (DUF1376 family)
MALRDQPYLPLYVDDFMVDEKLRECSAESTGVYIRLICLMHKSEEYGVILLKQKDKQNKNICLNFAYKLSLHMPYQINVIERSLTDLVSNGVIQMDEDKILQKRMVRDFQISETRSRVGKIGGEKTKFAHGFARAKSQANTVYVNENVIVNDNTKSRKKSAEKKPSIEKPIKSAYGSQNNVLLTPYELDRLRAKFPEHADDAVEYLSQYIAEKEYKSKSHNLAIQRWVIDAVKERKAKSGGKKISEVERIMSL